MHPVIFQIGPLTIHSFGLMVMVAFLVGGWMVTRELRRKGIEPNHLEGYPFWALIGGIVGARLYYLAENGDDLLRDFFGTLFGGAGLTWYGGAVGGAIAVLAYAHRQRQSKLAMCDAFAPGLAAAYGIGRIGCQLAGDGDYGPATDVPWAMGYPNGVVPTPPGVLVHPTPIYEILMMIPIVALLWILRTRLTQAGQLFGVYLMAVGAERWVAEIYRVRLEKTMGMSTAQWISLAAIAAGLVSPDPEPRRVLDMNERPGYELLDSGDGAKLERFGEFLLDRPSPQALWPRSLAPSRWKKATARYLRSRDGGGQWQGDERLPERWTARIGEIEFLLSATGFGHLGVFPEQAPFWDWIRDECRRESASRGRPPRVLNLFAYTGGSSLAGAQGGADVTHCDASKGVVRWASEIAGHNGLGEASIRWIVDDAMKFLARESRRESRYDAIILDPPSFGRGPKGQVFKLEEAIVPLLDHCAALMSDEPAFLLLSAHTPGIGPAALRRLLDQARLRHAPSTAEGGQGAEGEMFLGGKDRLPSGTWALWTRGASIPDPRGGRA